MNTRCLALLLLSFLFPPAVQAGLIRDAEIEHTLRLYADPIFAQAGLEPQNVRIFIVQDDAINAFVAGGANLFLHTGLIKAARDPGMLLGVIAHETGHIAGGHLARGAEQLKDAQLGVILGYVLGAAAVAAGGADVGMAVMTGGQQAVTRNLLSFTRTNEQSADQAALTYLDGLGISASGMLRMFETLRKQEMRQFGTPDPYALTHPLSTDRIAAVRAHAESASIPEDAYPSQFNLLHRRMLAKLYGFLDTPPKTLARYPLSDASLPARMARAIAWYKTPDIARAEKEMDALIAENPRDAFLLELEGQMLFENGRIAKALDLYRRANALFPNSALMLTSLAEAELAEGSPANAKAARASLEKAVTLDGSNPHSWRLLATAYGKTGDIPRSDLALAEEGLLQAKPDICLRQAGNAAARLTEASPSRLRAEDLKRVCEEMRKRKKEAE